MATGPQCVCVCVCSAMCLYVYAIINTNRYLHLTYNVYIYIYIYTYACVHIIYTHMHSVHIYIYIYVSAYGSTLNRDSSALNGNAALILWEDSLVPTSLMKLAGDEDVVQVCLSVRLSVGLCVCMYARMYEGWNRSHNTHTLHIYLRACSIHTPRTYRSFSLS